MENLPSTIEALLEVLAEKFGTTIEHLWQIMIRQAIAEGVVYLVFVALLSVITYVVVKKISGMEDVYDKEITWFISGLLLVVLWLAPLIMGGTALTGLLNPEYWALRQILKVLGGG